MSMQQLLRFRCDVARTLSGPSSEARMRMSGTVAHARRLRYLLAACLVTAIVTPRVDASPGTPQRSDRGGAPPAGRQGAAGERGRGGGGLAAKSPDLPAGAFTASSTLAHTTLRHEWVDIPLGGQRLHTWIEYPTASTPAPVVVVMSHEAGLDDWMRAVADQLATEGFIAVAPDILSGRGPNGGNFDSFTFPADVGRGNE